MLLRNSKSTKFKNMSVEESLKRLTTSIDSLRSEIGTMKRDISSANDRLKSFDGKFQALQNSMNTQEMLFKGLSENVTKNATAIKTLDQQTKEHKFIIDNLSKKIEVFETSISEICEEHIYNALHKNNLLLFNIKKQSEDDTKSLLEYVTEIIKTNAGVDIDQTKISDIRTFYSKPEVASSPILITCNNLKSREFLLNKIAMGLRDKDKNKNKISASDDIHARTRAYNKVLNEKAKSLRDNGYNVYIPFSTPRKMMYKKKGTDDAYTEIDNIDFLPSF